MLTNNFRYAYQILSVNQNRFYLFFVDVPKVLYSSIYYTDVVYGEAAPRGSAIWTLPVKENLFVMLENIL